MNWRTGEAAIRCGKVLALAALAVALMGLGGGDQGAEGDIPIPSKSYTVTLTDTQNNTLEGERFTWEGNVHVRAKFGNATITIPFEKLRSMRMNPGATPEVVNVEALLKSGETLALTIEATSKCYAVTKFGNYEIFMGDLASIDFK
ncbi:MAG: hypothetical protein O7D96_08400 [SAR324 cluster bacterium]|nr:hypothetical protein [SAR324 cluster bacterium]